MKHQRPRREDDSLNVENIRLGQYVYCIKKERILAFRVAKLSDNWNVRKEMGKCAFILVPTKETGYAYRTYIMNSIVKRDIGPWKRRISNLSEEVSYNTREEQFYPLYVFLHGSDFGKRSFTYDKEHNAFWSYVVGNGRLFTSFDDARNSLLASLRKNIRKRKGIIARLQREVCRMENSMEWGLVNDHDRDKDRLYMENELSAMYDGYLRTGEYFDGYQDFIDKHGRKPLTIREKVDATFTRDVR